MTLGKILISALGMASLAAAVPRAQAMEERAAIPRAPRMEEREETFTTTLYTVSTVTHYVTEATVGVDPNAHLDSASNGTTILPGIAYAPYTATGGCKDESQIHDDFAKLNGSYSIIRIYGTDCDQVALSRKAIEGMNVKLFLGIWDVNSVADEAQKIIDGIDGKWNLVHTVSVGNERVNTGEASPETVVAAIKQARSLLRAAGYHGPVVTVDTFVAVIAHPELCEASDYCAFNAHAFFDATVVADQAGTWLTKTVTDVKGAISGQKKFMVTESGWPCQGLTNGLAVPSASEQKAAIASIRKAFAHNLDEVVLFSAFNTPWKVEEIATFNAEPFWGIDGATSSS